MLNTRKTPTSNTLTDDFEVDTPEKRLLIQSLAQKLMHRVCEINFDTQHIVKFEVDSTMTGDLSVGLIWWVNGDLAQQARPNHENLYCYSWFSSADIEKWFLDAHIGLDLLVAENKAA